MVRQSIYLAAALILAHHPAAIAEDKPKAENTAPRILLAIPPGITANATVKLTLRGAKLDTAGTVELSGGLTAKVLSKGKAAVPQGFDGNRVGDTQIEIEVSTPAELPDEVTVVAVLPSGKTEPHRLLVHKGLTASPDKDPNGGFRDAAPLAVNQSVDGLIERGQDVDVFRVEGKADQKIAVEVFAAKVNSPLDAIVTIHGASGSPLAASDDTAKDRDPQLEFTFPSDGPYYVAIQDAHDQGSAIHAYRLTVTPR